MWEVLRLVNLGLAVFAAALLMATAHAWWCLLPRAVKWVCVSFGVILLGIAYSSGEQVARHTPNGLRVLFTGVSLAVLTAALVRLSAHRRDRP